MTQGMFPVRFAVMYLAFPPWWIRAMMGIQKLFISRNVLRRVKLLSSKSARANLFGQVPCLEDVRPSGCFFLRIIVVLPAPPPEWGRGEREE